MIKTDNPLVSIVVPVYNVAKYIDECLDSLLNQSFSNIEILLVDDASPDESGTKCDEWAAKDERIKVIHKSKNEGLNFARRDGLASSSGNWVSFVDSDDIVSKYYINDMIEVAQNKEVDIVVCRNKRFKNTEETHTDPVMDGVTVLKDKKKIFQHTLVNSPDADVFMITGWGKLFERSIIERIDWDLSNARSNEDELEAIQFYNNQNRGVAIIKKVLYYYRDNPDSIMNRPYSNVYGNKKYSRFEWIEHLYQTTTKYFGKNNPYENEVLYHNVLLNLLFLNKDITRGVFTDSEAEIFIKNVYPKLSQYQKIASKFPLKYEEKRAYDAIIKGGLYHFWHDDRKRLDLAHNNNAELQQQIANLQQHNTELNQRTTTLQHHNAELQQQINNLEKSKAYMLGRKISKPYVSIKSILTKMSK